MVFDESNKSQAAYYSLAFVLLLFTWHDSGEHIVQFFDKTGDRFAPPEGKGLGVLSPKKRGNIIIEAEVVEKKGVFGGGGGGGVGGWGGGGVGAWRRKCLR